jgi:hypothetical protein
VAELVQGGAAATAAAPASTLSSPIATLRSRPGMVGGVGRVTGTATAGEPLPTL